MKASHLLTTVAGVSLTALSLTAAPAQAATSSYWTSPQGRGTACSSTYPCSLATALGRVRATSSQRDVNLYFRGGTYSLTTPLSLGPQDGGSNGHQVSWLAAPGERPVISGAKALTSWTAVAGRAGVYRSRVAVGTKSRDLWVNGQAAVRAGQAASSLLGTVTGKDYRGYTVANKAFVSSPDAELVWTGKEGSIMDWHGHTERRCPATVAQGVVTVAHPCWDHAIVNKEQGVANPTRVENSLSLLDEAGEYYLDSANGYLYYKLRPGETPTTLKAFLPVSQGLLKAAGTSNLLIDRLEFTMDTWLQPSTPSGFVDLQANYYYGDTSGNNFLTPQATLDLRGVSNVTFQNSSLNRTGATGLSLRDGSHDNRVVSNYISLTGGTAVSVGGIIPSQQGDVNNLVATNDIREVALQYRGGVGIFGGYVRGLRVANNSIYNTSYSAISVGWGWGAPSTQGDNHIEENYLKNIMKDTTTVNTVTSSGGLFDGGAVYTLGTTDGAARSTIRGNYVDGVHGFGGAVYLDGSSNHWDVSENIIRSSDTHAVYVQDVPGSWALDNRLWNNCSTQGSVRTNSDPSNLWGANIVSPTCGGPAQ